MQQNKVWPSSIILERRYIRQQGAQNACAQRNLVISEGSGSSKQMPQVNAIGVSLTRFAGRLAGSSCSGSPISWKTAEGVSMNRSMRRSSFHRKCCRRMETMGFCGGMSQSSRADIAGRKLCVGILQDRQWRLHGGCHPTWFSGGLEWKDCGVRH